MSDVSGVFDQFGPAEERGAGRWADLADDLDAQIRASIGAEERAESDDVARGALGALTVTDRLRASVGRSVVLAVRGAGPVRGSVVGCGPDWVAVDDGGHEVIVLLVNLLSVSGVGSAAVDGRGGGVVARRWHAAQLLRRFVRDRSTVRVVLDTGDVVTGTLDMVGIDHLELAEHDAHESRRRDAVRGRRVVPFAAVATVSRERQI